MRIMSGDGVHHRCHAPPRGSQGNFAFPLARSLLDLTAKESDMGRVKAKTELDIFDVLTNEHRDVEALFDQIEARHEESPEEARDLFTVLYESLLAHAHAEQSVVYQRLAKIGELTEKVAEAKAEHEAVEHMLEELRAGQLGEAWLARLAVLQENVKHHVHEEEHEVFPTARERVKEDEARRLAASYLRAKARRTGEPETELAGARTPPKRGLWSRLTGLFH
jgi:hemerythrin superfamily protein